MVKISMYKVHHKPGPGEAKRLTVFDQQMSAREIRRLQRNAIDHDSIRFNCVREKEVLARFQLACQQQQEEATLLAEEISSIQLMKMKGGSRCVPWDKGSEQKESESSDNQNQEWHFRP